MNDGPMSHHCSPQILHLLRFFFLILEIHLDNLEQLPRIEIPACDFPDPEYPEYLLRGFSAERPAGSPGSPESRSRV